MGLLNVVIFLLIVALVGGAIVTCVLDEQHIRSREKVEQKQAQERIMAEAQAVATAADERLALIYDVDNAIAQAEQLLQAIHDEESE